MPIQRITGRVIEDGTITTADLNSNVIPAPVIPSGTAMLFAQTSAPTGWTKSTTHNDKALRVVSGTAGSGGSTAFTTVFASRTPAGTVGGTTLTTAQMPSHAHSVWQNAGSLSNPSYGTHYNTSTFSTFYVLATLGGAAGNHNNGTSNTGSGSSHNHSFTGTAMDFAVAYVDVIIATKD